MSLALTTRAARIRLTDLESVIERGLSTFKEVGQALLEIRDSRLYREHHRTFEDYCQGRWALGRPRAYQLMQAAEMSTVVDISNERQARELMPLKDDEQAVVDAWREAAADAEERGVPVTAAIVKNAVQKRVNRVERERQAEERRAQPIVPVTTLGNTEIRHGDLRVALADLEGQVDAIVTDPPYPEEFLDEFDALGEAAVRLLKPDGILAAMVGQTHLPAYIERLCRHLPYRWCGAYLTEGPATRIHGRKVGTKWKPILIFGGERFLTQDVFSSQGNDKAHHHWGQSESGFADLVERLTEPGDLVVDPFLGGGTTAFVCQKLGRRFVGCDVDGGAVEATRERLAA